jgi:hypothetical protein
MDGDRGDRNGRAGNVRARPPAGHGNVGAWHPFVDEEVGVGAAEAERADRGAARARPVLRLGQQAQRSTVERVDRGIGAQRPGAHPGPHRAEHLEQTRAPRSGQQVPDVGLGRADRQVGAVGEHPRHAARFHLVADGCAGRVTLHQRHAARRNAGCRVGEPHRPLLPLLRGGEQAPGPAIVGQSDRPDHAEDRDAGADRVAEPHQGHQGGALAGHEPVGRAVERARQAGRADRPQPPEPAVHERAVGAAHRPRHHEAGGAVTQAVAAELDRVQGRGAGGVQREAAGPEPERTRGEVGRQAGTEPIARIEVGCGLALPPDLLGERNQSGRGI